jgi:hypothetical protein
MKANLLLCLIKHHVKNKYGRVEEQVHIFLTLKLYGSERLSFTLVEVFTRTNSRGSCVGTTAKVK